MRRRALHPARGAWRGAAADPPLGLRYRPFWSPDSGRIAFIDNTQTIRILEVASGAVTDVDKGLYWMHPALVGFEMAWSADSRWLAWHRAGPGATEVGSFSLVSSRVMGVQLTGESVVVVGPDQASTKLTTADSESIAVLGLEEGAYYELKGVGVRIWELIQNPTTVDGVVETLVAEFVVDRERCEADLIALLRRMVEKGLVEVRDSPSS